jgi:hypothetical protein
MNDEKRNDRAARRQRGIYEHPNGSEVDRLQAAIVAAVMDAATLDPDRIMEARNALKAHLERRP